jgi:ATP-dependent Clp protease adaptor protein ClpS
VTKKIGQGEASEEGDVVTLERQKTKKPRRYFVVMHNDDYTTQEFVVYVITRFFHKSAEEANRLMILVHTQGKAIVGVYTRDIAETKVRLVTDYAREHGMPLLLTAEPE